MDFNNFMKYPIRIDHKLIEEIKKKKEIYDKEEISDNSINSIMYILSSPEIKRLLELKKD